MPKITDEDLEAIQVRLFKSDLDYLRSLYRGSIGVNKAIRLIVRRDVNYIKSQAADIIDQEESRQQLAVATEDLL